MASMCFSEAWALILAVASLAACGGTTDPARSAAGTWALQSVDGGTLPHDYSYTATDGQVVHRSLVADTLILSDTSSRSSSERLWFDDGTGPQLEETFLFVTDEHDDSFVINLITGSFERHQATLDGARLRVVVPSEEVRAGLYDYSRAGSQ